MEPTDQEVAVRALGDAEYAREVLNGDGYPRVREAILADWNAGEEVRGFFNPQPDPPGRPPEVQQIDFNAFSMGWDNLPRPSLKALAQGG
jgi:hypothetical protein